MVTCSAAQTEQPLMPTSSPTMIRALGLSVLIMQGWFTPGSLK